MAVVVDPADVPPLESTGSPEVLPSVAEGDFGPTSTVAPFAAELPAPQTRESTGFVEGKSRLDELLPTGSVYVNPDGTRTARLYQDVVNVPDGRGGLQPADTTLVDDGKTIVPKAAAAGVSFPRARDGAIKVTTPSGALVTLGLGGFDAATAKVEGSTVTYAGPASGQLLEYRMLTSGAKQNIILDKAPAAASWTFAIESPTLRARLLESGAVELIGADGKAELSIPVPVMFDSNVDPLSMEPGYGEVSQSLKQTADGRWDLTVTADAKWLASAERVWPVYVDPAYMVASTAYNQDTFVSDRWTTANYNVNYEPALGVYTNKVGYYDGTTGTNWTYLGYDISPVMGKNIQGATWHGYWAHAYYPTTPTTYKLNPIVCGWDASTMTWSTRACVDDTVPVYGSAVRDAWSASDVTGIIAAAAGGSRPWYGLEVDTNGEGTGSWKKLAAAENGAGGASYIDIWYNTTPTVPGIAWPSPADGGAYNQENFTLHAYVADADGDPLYATFYVGLTPDVMSSLVYAMPELAVTGSIASSPEFSFPSISMGPNGTGQTYYWKVWVSDWQHAQFGPTWSWSTTNQRPDQPTAVSPSAGAVTTSLTPTLTASGTDADGNALQHYFQATTGGGAVVAASGWLPAGTSSWAVPANVLRDGQVYSWRVATRDFPDVAGSWSALSTFKVDRRLGAQGPLPGDSVGPVVVSLATGNASTSVSTPGVATLGGNLGVTITYNSMAAADTGLTGSYFGGTGLSGVIPAGDQPVLVRTDPQVNFDFGTDSPYSPAITGNAFRIRWQGYLTVPVTGTYYFGSTNDNSFRIDISASPVWTAAGLNVGTPAYSGTGVALTAGSPVPILAEYANLGGPGHVAMYVTMPGGSQQLVNPTWLSTLAPALPQGWSMSADVSGPGSGYVRAAYSANAVVLTDATGAAHTYLPAASGNAYTPPAGQFGQLTRASDGSLTLLDGGMTWVFSPAGLVASAATAADDLHPAAAAMTYAGAIPRLSAITDPVSGRALTLRYGGSDPECAAPGGGWAPAPAGMLCRIELPDGTAQTLYYYLPAGATAPVLSRILQPGGAAYDYGFNPSGLLGATRGPQAVDWLDAAPGRDGNAVNYGIGYDGSGRANLVQSPEPNGMANTPSQRLVHTISYVSATETQIAIAGLSPPSGYARKVTLDASLRMVADYDASGLATTYGWDAADRQLWVKDPAGRVSTTIWDARHNPVDAYGPAPASCFDPTAPAAPTSTAGACADIPRTSTGYDEGMTGLAAAWWDNDNKAGPTTIHSTLPLGTLPPGVAPAAGLPGTGPYSGTLTGRIQLPTTGAYTFAATVPSGAGARLFIDDAQVFDGWRTYRQTVINGGGTAPAASLLGYWRLGEASGSTAADSSGNSRDGAYTGSLTRAQASALAGDADPSLAYPAGAGNVQIPHSTAFDLTGELTLEAWINPANDSGYHAIITKDLSNGPTNNTFEFRVNPDRKLQFLQADGTTYYSSTSTGGLASGWRHVAVTKTAAGLVTFYIDGVADSSFAMPNGVATNTRPVYIGGRDDGMTFTGGIDEAAIYSTALTAAAIATQAAAGQSKLTGTTVSMSAGTHRIRLDYSLQAGSPASGLELSWAAGAASPAAVPDSALTPDYGLRTSTTTYDGAAGAGGDKTTAYAYDGGGLDPAYGLATDITQDPGGLALTTRTRYEPVSGGTYLRPTASALPAADVAVAAQSTTYAYYGAAEAVANPCVGGAPIVQGGRERTATSPTGVSGIPREVETVYDTMGRVVASRTVADGSSWTCTTYDARGRIASIAYPAYGGAAARTVAYDYAVGGNPLTGSVSDPAGTITTTVDLAGRTLSYTDASGVATTTAYDPAGLASSSAVTVGATTQTLGYGYDTAGRPTTQALNGSTLSTTGYDGNGQISSVAYNANGTSLASIGRDNSGRTTALTWSLTDGGIRDTVTRSQAGDVMTGAVHTGTVVSGALTSPVSAAAYSYTYDAASRLTAATAPGHTFTYGFGTTTCTGVPGAVTTAGRNTNRTSSTDVYIPIGGGSTTTTTTENCYDRADRLLKTTTGATTMTPVYDSHGSTTTLGDQALGYDSANRHLTTALAGGGGTVYVRDAADRIVSAAATPPGGAPTTTRYGFTGTSDSAAVMLDAAGAYAGITIGLPGGATVTITPAAQQWSYPNIHGSVIATADGAGARGAAPIYCYDPFGQPLVKATGAIDTDAVPASLTGTLDNGWLGGNQRPYEHTGSIATIEMGHRQYIPALGRFIEIDPIRGGSANDYDYVGGDPINGWDIDGLRWQDGFIAARNWVTNNRSAIASVAATGACVLSTLAVCGGFAAAGFLVRWQDRGFQDWRTAAWDSIFTLGAVGLMRVGKSALPSSGFFKMGFAVQTQVVVGKIFLSSPSIAKNAACFFLGCD